MKVCAFLTDGFETVEALAVIDILRRADIRTDMISITGDINVKSAQGVVVKADALLDGYVFEGDELLFLPGGPGHKSYYECNELLTLLKEYDKKNNRIAAICAAPSILGNLGLLEGKKAMAFPGFEDQLKGAEIIPAPQRVVTDGNITTSRGMGTSIDLGLELVKLIKGEELSDKLRASTQYIYFEGAGLTMESDNYNEVEIRRDRKRKAQLRRKKRQRALRIKLIIMTVAAIVIAVVIINVTSGLRKTSKQKAAFASDIIAETYAENETQTQQSTEPPLIYSQMAADYKDLSSDTQIASPYAALLDVNNHKIIAGKLADSKIYPASMTKVMTLIVVSENIDKMPQTYTFGFEMLNRLYVEEASVAGFLEGETVDVEDLMYGLVLPSGADAAEALAIMVAGSNEEFAKLMNEKCQELGLKYTHFTNPTGLYDEEQYTTPSEMAMIMEYAMKDETRAKVLGTYQYKTKATAQHPEGIQLTSTMYSRIYGNEAPGVLVTGGKTGYTNEAGSCLVSYAVTNKGNAYVFCTGGATYRWAPVYDEIYVYKNIIPESAKDLETETTKMSPNN